MKITSRNKILLPRATV